MKKPAVFISSSWSMDRSPRVVRFIKDLKEDPRVDVWDPSEELKVGDTLWGKLAGEIRASDSVIFIVPSAPAAAGVQNELRLALSDQIEKQKAKLVPVMLDRTEPPRYLRSLDIVDLTVDYEVRVERLIEELVSAC